MMLVASDNALLEELVTAMGNLAGKAICSAPDLGIDLVHSRKRSAIGNGLMRRHRFKQMRARAKKVAHVTNMIGQRTHGEDIHGWNPTRRWVWHLGERRLGQRVEKAATCF